jgi:AraC-like DNA-binding protein
MTSNIALAFSAFLGYILIFLTLKNPKYNRILNSFLMFMFFISSTLLLIAGIAGIYNDSDLKAFYAKSNIYIALFVPFFYLYFKYLIRDHQRFLFKDFMHIIFLFLAILERKFLLFDTLFDCKLNYFFSQFFAVYAIIYLIKIFLLLKKNVWNKKATLSIVMTQNELIKKWSIILFSVLVINIIRFYFVYYRQYLFFEPIIIGHSVEYLWASALVYIVLFVIILSYPEILYGYYKFQTEASKINPDSYINNYWNLNSKIQINNTHDQALKEKISSKIESYIFELNVVLYNNSYFINPNFSIKDLAQVLNIPKSHLTFIFKYHSEISFSDYKKISRIQNSLELINNKYLTSNTLDSLARKVGFSSYNPFFSCFKDVVGKTPREYVSTIKSNLNKLK